MDQEFDIQDNQGMSEEEELDWFAEMMEEMSDGGDE